MFGSWKTFKSSRNSAIALSVSPTSSSSLPYIELFPLKCPFKSGSNVCLPTTFDHAYADNGTQTIPSKKPIRIWRVFLPESLK